MMMGGKTLLLGLVSASIGCSTASQQETASLKAASYSVQVVGNADAVKSCAFVAGLSRNDVEMTAYRGHSITEGGFTSYEEEIRRAAAVLDADHALLGVGGHVDFYKCSQPERLDKSESTPSLSDSTTGCAFVGIVNKASCNGSQECLMEKVTSLGGDKLFFDASGGAMAYRCGGQPSQATATPSTTQAGAPAQPATPAATAPVPPSKVRIVISETEIRGCTFVDPIDDKILCPDGYPQGVPCMAYRTAKQGGNVVLASGAGKVYSCPVKP